jgi:hypothetical protein
MHNNPIIRRFFAGLLLLLFAFGSTPKKTLHDFFADHKDLSARRTGDIHTAQLIDKGFSCDCESLVVEFPFTETSGIPELTAPSFFWPSGSSEIRNTFHPGMVRLSGLRGPPRA